MMSNILNGYFTKVIVQGGHLMALFKTKKELPNAEYYLYLPEREKETGEYAFSGAWSIYQTHCHTQTLLSVTIKKQVGQTSTGLPKLEVETVQEYKKRQANIEKATADIQAISEDMRNNVAISIQAKIHAAQRALALDKLEDDEKEHLCLLIQCSPKRANYCREDLGGTKNYYFSVNYNKEEIKKFQAETRDDLFFQVTQYANSLNRKEQQDE
ncbi:hypothetical protein V9L05_15175 [Bernardetia sp. Wsw4-3y2]|uniref:hypothetical protein n=1 Tax=Bernardetia sp. Wsw4-3y2 TaxID=3127471 RepID=UPI0030CBC527